MTILLYVLFILSGAAGLIYESIWSRYLGLFVGHSAYAQIIVLAIFLGGMSMGALVAGERSARLREPLVWYAIVELVVGLIGLAFHDVFVGVTRFAYDSLFPLFAGNALLTAVKWTLASLLILPQSILLGASFPLMSAGALRRGGARPGRVLALLYFANSLGAAGGVLVAGFYLVDASGLPGTLLAAVIVNLVVALATLLGVRLLPADAAAAPRPEPAALRPERAAFRPERTASVPGPLPLSVLWRLLLLVSAGTAVASFVYEIAWIRMLALVLGSASHSFELMLSAFILGLALGALWTHRYADRFADPLRALGLVQCAMGAAALATLPLYLQSFHWTATLLKALGPTEQGYTLYTLARYGLCLAVMLPATFCAGITLPLITRTLLVAGGGERAVGRVYGVNTLGAIFGVILAGLLLLPLTGLKLLLVCGAVIDMALGIALLSATGRSPARRRLTAGAAVALAAVVALAVLGVDLDRHLLSSGVYRYAVVHPKSDIDLVYYRDGRTTTVAVGRVPKSQMMFLSTNGKAEGSVDTTPRDGTSGDRRPLSADTTHQILLPMITLAHAPAARTAAVIGVGTGMSSHMLLGSERLERLVTIEIEPLVLEGARRFRPLNHRLFDDPRARVVIDDAKSFFAADRHRYDLILSIPSSPWVNGVSGLFTTEFYQRVRRYLADGGVFGQWLHLYEINDGLVLSVLAAVHQNFPTYEVFMIGGTDILIVASGRGPLRAPDWSVLAWPAIAKDLGPAPVFPPRMLEGARLLSRAALAPLLDGWNGPNSDFFPVLDLGAERTRYLRTNARGFQSLGADRFDLVAAFTGVGAGFAVEPINPVVGVPRIHALATGAALRGDTRHAIGLPDLGEARQRRWRFEAGLASAAAPVDWRVWLRDMLLTEAEIHGGTAGVADEMFYQALARFADRHAAPRPVLHAVGFAEGLARWDWAGVVRASEVLVPLAESGAGWLPIDHLRAGAVMAHLRLGDLAGARRAFDALATRSQWSPDDLRGRLLEAYLVAFERGRAR